MGKRDKDLCDRGWELYENQEYRSALDFFEQAIMINNKNADAHVGKGECLNEIAENAEDYRLAIKEFDVAIAIAPKESGAFSGKGDSFNELEQYDDAIKWFNHAIELDQKNVDAYIGKATALEETFRYKEALDVINVALTIDRNNSDVRFKKAYILTSLKCFSDAIKEYDRVLELDKDHLICYTNKAELLTLFFNKYEEALKICDIALSKNKDFYPAYYQKGCAYFARKSFDNAILMYDKAIDLETNYAMAYSEKALAYSAKGMDVEAIKLHDIAIRIEPQLCLPYFYKANAMWRLGKIDEAQEYFSKAHQLSKNPDGFEAKHVEEDYTEKGMDYVTLIPRFASIASIQTQDQSQKTIQSDLVVIVGKCFETKSIDNDNILRRIRELEDAMKVVTARVDKLEEKFTKIEVDAKKFEASLNRKDIFQKEKSEIHSIINDEYKFEVYRAIRKELGATYLASVAISTGMVENSKTEAVGKIGALLGGVGQHVPLIGSGIKILGDILKVVDKNLQSKKIKKFAEFADSITDMEIFAKVLARKIVLSNFEIQLPKEGILSKVGKIANVAFDIASGIAGGDTIDLSSIDVSSILKSSGQYLADKAQDEAADLLTDGINEASKGGAQGVLAFVKEKLHVSKSRAPTDLEIKVALGQVHGNFIAKIVTGAIFSGKIESVRDTDEALMQGSIEQIFYIVKEELMVLPLAVSAKRYLDNEATLDVTFDVSNSPKTDPLKSPSAAVLNDVGRPSTPEVSENNGMCCVVTMQYEVKYENPLLGYSSIVQQFIRLYGVRVTSELIDLTSQLDKVDVVTICTDPNAIDLLEMLIGISHDTT